MLVLLVGSRRMVASFHHSWLHGRGRNLTCGYSTGATNAASPPLPRTAGVVRASRLFRPTFSANQVAQRGAAASGVPSVELLLRGGHVRQSTAGVFTLLPSGLRILRKISEIVRQEMADPSGVAASELSMPALLPSALWKTSGRWQSMQSELLTLTTRSGTEYLLGPTHEEEVTQLVAHEAPSYRSLPVRVYQITSKFRNELRPRAGLLRTREFLMKDLYTFDADPEAARKAYHEVRDAYARLFDRLLGSRHGRWLSAVADTGAIGGELSHEYHFPDPLGEDTLLSCSSCDGLWNQELAYAAPRTAGANLPTDADEVQVALFAPPKSFETQTPVSPVPGTEDAGATPASPSQLYAFVVPKDRTLSEAAVVRTSKGVNLKPVHLGKPEIGPSGLNSFFNTLKLHVDQDCTFMDPSEMMEAVSRSVLAAVDAHAANMLKHGTWGRHLPTLYDLFPPTTVVNQTGIETQNTIESQVGSFSQAEVGDLCGHCARRGIQSPLQATKSIEVAHAFLLGTRYSDALNVGFTPAPGSPAAEIAAKRDAEQLAKQEKHVDSEFKEEDTTAEVDPLGVASHRHVGQAPFQMGCYGVGISRLIGALAQRASARGGEKSLVWPRSISPYIACVLTPALDNADQETQQTVEHTLRLLTSSSPEAYQARSKVQSALESVRSDVGAKEVSFVSSPLALDDVLLDDRAASVPKRLIDAELTGAPIILVLGRAWQKNREIEVIVRDAVPQEEQEMKPNATLLPSRRVTALVKLEEAELLATSP